MNELILRWLIGVLDLSMQLNEGLFAMNGRCGYVLKPTCMTESRFNPFEKQTLTDVDPVTISLTVSLPPVLHYTRVNNLNLVEQIVFYIKPQLNPVFCYLKALLPF